MGCSVTSTRLGIFGDPGSLRNKHLPLCYWEGGGVIHVHLDLFAEAFYPPGTPRFSGCFNTGKLGQLAFTGLCRGHQRCKKHRWIHERWEQNGRTSFFVSKLGFQSFCPQNSPKFLTKINSQLWIFFIFSSYLRHVHHHHPSSQVDPCTISSSYVKSAERRSQPLKKLQPRKLRSNWASGNEAKFWDESSYNVDHLTYITPLGGSSQLVSG